MDNRNDYGRQPRWDRGAKEDREGDRSQSRNNNREDMRRYGQRSIEQGDRLRRMRGQGNEARGNRPGSHFRAAYNDQDRQYGSAYDRERDYHNNENTDRDLSLEGSGNPGRREYDSYWDRVEDRYRNQGERWFDRGPRQDRGADRYGNFWGEREQGRSYHDRDRGEWWDNAGGQPDITSAREINGNTSPWPGEDWLEDRNYDLDPGYSYEFGTDFDFLNDTAVKQSQHDRQSNEPIRATRGDRIDFWNVPGPFTGVGPSNYRRSDERIMEDICEIFTRHGEIDASGIDIQVEDGQVTLTGSVGRRSERYLAEDLASQVRGVMDVENQIKEGLDRPSVKNQPKSGGSTGS